MVAFIFLQQLNDRLIKFQMVNNQARVSYRINKNMTKRCLDHIIILYYVFPTIKVAGRLESGSTNKTALFHPSLLLQKSY